MKDKTVKLISLNNLSIGYEGKVIIENLNLTINQGDYICIIGENGSGKTTLMKTLLNLIKPISGDIIFENGFANKGIGYLPQQTIAQRDFPASVTEVVLSGLQNRVGFRPFYNKTERDIAFKNISKMHLEGLEKKCYRELSGGQQQRVLLARALCATDKLLLLDEPVSGLDVDSTEEMYKAVEELNKQDNITIIMISHDVNSVLKYADKVLYIGNELFFGSKSEYITEVKKYGNI